MKIGAYQFAVSGNINHNMEIIKKAIIQASREGVRLLVFSGMCINRISAPRYGQGFFGRF